MRAQLRGERSSELGRSQSGEIPVPPVANASCNSMMISRRFTTEESPLADCFVKPRPWQALDASVGSIARVYRYIRRDTAAATTRNIIADNLAIARSRDRVWQMDIPRYDSLESLRPRLTSRRNIDYTWARVPVCRLAMVYSRSPRRRILCYVAHRGRGRPGRASSAL